MVFIFYLFRFLLLSLKNYICILGRNSVSDMQFKTVVSQCLASLLSLIKHISELKFLILIKQNLYFFHLIDCAFVVKSRKNLHSLRSQRISPMVLFLKFLLFYVLHSYASFMAPFLPVGAGRSGSPCCLHEHHKWERAY